jgi:hypothetical protein
VLPTSPSLALSSFSHLSAVSLCPNAPAVSESARIRLAPEASGKIFLVPRSEQATDARQVPDTT